jgi:Tfp pilus assembly protein FimT
MEMLGMMTRLQSGVHDNHIGGRKGSWNRQRLSVIVHLLNQQGFTLVGLLITTAILGLVAEGLALTLVRYMPTHRLYSATRHVLADLTAARRLAISQHQDITVEFLDDHVYRIWQDRDQDGILDPHEHVQKIGNLQDDYADVTFSGTLPLKFVISRRGLASTFLQVDLENTSGAKTISVSRSGKMTIL